MIYLRYAIHGVQDWQNEYVRIRNKNEEIQEGGFSSRKYIAGERGFTEEQMG
jgi:hypothetical protein